MPKVSTYPTRDLTKVLGVDSGGNVGLASLGAFEQLALGGNGALRMGLPSQAPALTTSPTITVGTSTPGGTQIVAATSAGPATNRFTFGGRQYVQASTTFPFTQAARELPTPYSTLGFGAAAVDFLSDAPTIAFKHARDESGSTRILVDGSEVWRCVPGIRANTAQAGDSSTITFDSGASATNGIYVGNWVHITGGTGAGQYQQVSAYVGSTKVATMDGGWSTAPDNTSTFEITDSKAPYSNLTNTGVTAYFPSLAWGERRMRHYRIEHAGQAFYGAWVTAIDTVEPCPKPNATRCIWLGDSFSAGIGADLGVDASLARVTCDQLGWEILNISAGGTGYLNPSSGSTLSFSAVQRANPPANAWAVQYNGASAGSFTLTQNGIPVTVGFGDSTSTIQSAFDGAFGAGTFSIVSGGAATARFMWAMGIGSNASFAGAMTANFSGLTGASAAAISQYLGDIAPNVPVDGNGNIVPFNIVLACGHNDTTDSNAAYTPAAVQAAVTGLLQALAVKYPQATIYVIGNMFLPGASFDSAVTNCDAAILAACNAALPKINGTVPFIETLSPAWFTGTGNIGNLKNDGNSDICCFTDGVHPTTLGHLAYGNRIARAIQAFWGL